MAKKVNPVSIANLQPAKEGEVKNKYGRKGKSGTGGLSLKSEYRNYIQNIPAEERNAVWQGLYMKAMTGDVAAIKLWVELNGEIINEQVQVQDNGTRIVIQMPAMEGSEEIKYE